ncbi:MAG: hypothetical protein ACE5HV_17465, partial [Acidobacteriota bacterium]
MVENQLFRSLWLLIALEELCSGEPLRLRATLEEGSLGGRQIGDAAAKAALFEDLERRARRSDYGLSGIVDALARISQRVAS